MTIDVLSATLRALSFVALFQAAGIVLFIVIFGARLDRVSGQVRHVGRVSAAIAIALLIAQYLLEGARMSGELAGVLDASLQGIVLHSSTAAAFGCRLAGLAIIGVTLRMPRATPTLSARRFPPGLLGILLVVASFTLVGHTASHPHRLLLDLLLAAHLLVGFFWFGALAPLYVACLRESAEAAGALIQAFSRLALWIVPILLVAGVALAAILLQSLAGLRTIYGELLLAKLGVFAALLALGAYNKWRLAPAVSAGDHQAMRAFQRSLAAEYLLLTAALSVTAVLTSFYSPD